VERPRYRAVQIPSSTLNCFFISTSAIQQPAEVVGQLGVEWIKPPWRFVLCNPPPPRSPWIAINSESLSCASRGTADSALGGANSIFAGAPPSVITVRRKCRDCRTWRRAHPRNLEPVPLPSAAAFRARGIRCPKCDSATTCKNSHAGNDSSHVRPEHTLDLPLSAASK